MNQLSSLWDDFVIWLVIAVLVAWGRNHTEVTKLKQKLEALENIVGTNVVELGTSNTKTGTSLDKLREDFKTDIANLQRDVEHIRRTAIDADELERYLTQLNKVVDTAINRTNN